MLTEEQVKRLAMFLKGEFIMDYRAEIIERAISEWFEKYYKDG